VTTESRRIAALSIVAKWAGTEVFPAAKIEGDTDMTFGQVVRLVKKLNEANFRGLIESRKDLRSEGSAHVRTYAVLRVRLQTTGLALGWATLMPTMDFAAKFLVSIEEYDQHRKDSALTRAIGKGELGQVRWLLRAGVDVNGPGPVSFALYTAATYANPAILDALVAAGADVNRRSAGREMTPLHIASERGHEGAVRALLNAKADVDARDYQQATPLDMAMRGKHDGVVRLLSAALEKTKGT
jgi:hypothetical protein